MDIRPLIESARPKVGHQIIQALGLLQQELDRIRAEVAKQESSVAGLQKATGVQHGELTPPGTEPGYEWASLVNNFTAVVEYAIDQLGGQVWRVKGTFDPPVDSEGLAYQGVRIIKTTDGVNLVLVTVEPRTSAGYISRWYPVPNTPTTWTIAPLSIGPGYNVNSYVPGVTPKVDITVQHQAGVGGVNLKRVDTSTIDPQEFQLNPASGILEMKQLHAGKMVLGESLKVGGGATQKVGQIGVFDNLDAMTAWIGKYGSITGAHFKQLWVGGTIGAPSSAPFRVDASGNVVMDNFGLANHCTFSLNLGNVLTEIKNVAKGSYVAGIKVSDSTYATWLTQARLFFKGTPANDLLEIGAFSPSEGFLRIWHSNGSDCAFMNHYYLQFSAGSSIVQLMPTGLYFNGVAAIDGSRNGNLASLSVGGSTAIDASRNGYLTSLLVGGLTVIDASRNISNVGSVAASGAVSGRLAPRYFLSPPSLDDGEQAYYWDGAKMWLYYKKGANTFKVELTLV